MKVSARMMAPWDTMVNVTLQGTLKEFEDLAGAVENGRYHCTQEPFVRAIWDVLARSREGWTGEVKLSKDGLSAIEKGGE